MYNVDQLIGKVATVRLVGGEELITTIIGIDEDYTTVTVGHPMVVVVDSNNISLLPFAVTSNVVQVIMNTNNILAIMPTSVDTAKAYIEMIKSESDK